MTILWGTPETEQGRTVYRLLDMDRVKVKDFVLKGDDWHKFGEARVPAYRERPVVERSTAQVKAPRLVAAMVDSEQSNTSIPMNADLHIRAFKPRDESAVVDLWKVVFPDDPPWNEPADVIARKLSVQRDLFLVGIIDGRLIGTVLAGFDGVRGWVHKLAVHPELRRRGVAAKLMEAAERGLVDLGCPKVNLQVRSTNTAVVEFYLNAGYSIEDRVSMGKRLV